VSVLLPYALCFCRWELSQLTSRAHLQDGDVKIALESISPYVHVNFSLYRAETGR
jgi:hypothetical protein